ncbi:MAG: aminoacyl-tRNA hydrolase [Planctomycetaceae bacterium]|jgi:ribosome-associated protein|nr:aminoacyl-tRNA hydrolase [Planctomycetaceae bacterium]
MPEQHLIINTDIRIPMDAIRFFYVRSSGPGGQNVNKVSSKAVLRWNPEKSLSESVVLRFRTLFPRCWTNDGEIVITSQRTRDALKNKTDCLEKLCKMLQQAAKEPKLRIPTRPTKNSIRKRLENKAINSQKKQKRRKINLQDNF